MVASSKSNLSSPKDIYTRARPSRGAVPLLLLLLLLYNLLISNTWRIPVSKWLISMDYGLASPLMIRLFSFQMA